MSATSVVRITIGNEDQEPSETNTNGTSPNAQNAANRNGTSHRDASSPSPVSSSLATNYRTSTDALATVADDIGVYEESEYLPGLDIPNQKNSDTTSLSGLSCASGITNSAVRSLSKTGSYTETRKRSESHFNTSAVEIRYSTNVLRLIPEVLRTRFKDQQLENLYREYTCRFKRHSLCLLLYIGIITNISGLAVSGVYYSEDQLVYVIINSIFFLTNCIIRILIWRKLISEFTYNILPYLIWIFVCGQLCLDIFSGSQVIAPNAMIGWHCFVIFTLYTSLPVHITMIMLLCIASILGHCLIVTLSTLGQPEEHLFDYAKSIPANLFLFLAANVLGISVYVKNESQLRQSFVEARESLSDNLIIEQGFQEQERLLLSVLPKHVASEMMRDVGADLTGQFRKIYMNRHQNVSILFADIVGFTAMSSKVTPQQLIVILNDLFALFDRLAAKFRQMRIKILGDCYYCISGCPDPREDHAVLCIHMGLAVVDAIAQVRERTQSGVNMRVGIHTGAILAGVLGQHRWQYDVLGKEVTLANQMESGGLPGKVHISSATADCLNGEFQLEPGEGETREEGIKRAGLKTYLIKNVIKPYPTGTLEDQVRSTDGQSMKTVSTESENSIDDIGAQYSAENLQKFRDEIKKHTDRSLWRQLHPVTMQFKDGPVEQEFSKSKQQHYSLSLVIVCLVTVCLFLAQVCILPIFVIPIVTFTVALVLLLVMATIPISNVYPKYFPERARYLAGKVSSSSTLWSIYLLVALSLMACGDMVDVLTCDSIFTNDTTPILRVDFSCPVQYSTYFSHMAVLAMTSPLLMSHLSSLVKSMYVMLVALIWCIIQMIVKKELFDNYDHYVMMYTSEYEQNHIEANVSLSIMLITIALAAMFVARQSEYFHRQIFSQRVESSNNRGRIDVMTTKNEQLLYNILPAHVAKDFVGQQRNDEELYSHAHDEVAVMFASCPNFTDNYSEAAFNNNGIEWMRLLNEILSDYDELLNDPRFRDVIKIKTIGPTYMAASGMNRGEEPFTKDTPITYRWHHLSQLVDFAFAMKETLDRINSQSFNTFMLRIGINHGPILAGIIGATKPHYDIWGNTVNVSSRMDSTGQLGKIQVVEDTKLILQEFGYTFEQRGLVKVKGKGELMTYFLTGKDPNFQTSISPLPNQVTEL